MSDTTSFMATGLSRSGPSLVRQYGFLLACVIATALALLVAPSTMGIDDTLHVQMVRALVDHGALHIAETGGVEASPALQTLLTHSVDGKVMPQYPSGYAFLAAPFYLLLGIKGLVLMNALSLVVILWATRRLALTLFADDRLAWIAMALLGLASFLPVYGFIILPHLSSLALVMLAAERSAHAASEAGRSRFRLWLALAGLCLGIAVNLRVDVILAMACLVFWVRLFGLPNHRSATLLLIAGMVPGLLVASVLNDAKFGSFVPISYGPKSGADSMTKYMAPFALLSAAFLLSFLVDTSGPRFRALWARIYRRNVLLGGLMIAGLGLLLVPAARGFLFNAWVLVVDLQQASDWQARLGLQRDEWGFANFYGLNKKALVQSMPWFALCAFPLAALFQGRDVRSLSLCFSAMAAIFAFYSLRQWHGGFAVNMRYFLPALPFAAILGAYALCQLWARFPSFRLSAQSWRILIVAGLALLAISGAAGQVSPIHKAALFLLPLGLAGVLLAALFALLLPTGRTHTRPAALSAGLVGLSLGHASMASAFDMITYQSRLNGLGPHIEAVSTSFPDGALIVTRTLELFLDVRESGAHIADPGLKIDMERSRIQSTVDAFRSEGRCVYVHTGTLFNSLTLNDSWASQSLETATGSSQDFYVPTEDAARCAL
ncbi:MAG: hypothetical protein MRY64_08805 [Hyphomonadaceae bacterium]|nr:hypothetical protein [Hyphomonadaceae bacterium]